MPSGAETERIKLLAALGLGNGAGIDGARLDQLVDNHLPVFTDSEGNIVGPAGSKAANKFYSAASSLIPLKTLLSEAGDRPVAVQVIGDSTGNDATEWPRKFVNYLHEQYPDYSVNQVLWDGTASFMPNPVNIHAGPLGEQYMLIEAGKTTPSIATSQLPNMPAVLDFRIKLSTDDWSPPGGLPVFAGYENGAGNRSWWIQLTTTGLINTSISADGTALTSHFSTAAVPFADGATGWIRFVYNGDDGLGNRVLKYYTSTDGITWTQLGATLTVAGVMPLFNPPNGLLTVGGRGGNVGLPGKVFMVRVLDGENGFDIVPPYPSLWPRSTSNLVSFLGSPPLTLVNASYPGSNSTYFTDALLKKMCVKYGQVLLFLSNSHNENTRIDKIFVDAYNDLVTRIKVYLPDIPLVLLTQNPQNGTLHEQSQATRRINLINYALTKGYFYFDTYKKFVDYTGSIGDLLSDTVHPNSIGSDLWVSVIIDAFEEI